MGIGLILPVMPALIQEVSLTSMSDAALWGGLLTASYAAMQFCFGPFLGNLSDRFGRRPVLIVSLTFMGLEPTYQIHQQKESGHGTLATLVAHLVSASFLGHSLAAYWPSLEFVCHSSSLNAH